MPNNNRTNASLYSGLQTLVRHWIGNEEVIKFNPQLDTIIHPSLNCISCKTVTPPPMIICEYSLTQKRPSLCGYIGTAIKRIRSCLLGGLCVRFTRSVWTMLRPAVSFPSGYRSLTSWCQRRHATTADVIATTLHQRTTLSLQLFSSVTKLAGFLN